MTTSTTRRVALAAGVLSVAIVGVTGLASSALFTSTDASTGNDFAAGTVVLDANGGAAALTIDDTSLAPGTVKYGKLTIANQGTLGLRYAMTSQSSNADTKGLAGHLDVNVVPIAADATCDAAAISGGTAVFSGKLADAAFGSTSAGAQAGDRALGASTSEALCLSVSMSKNSAAIDNPFQGATTSTTFTFDAEQTLNNA
jgi:hypothetical protein